MMNIKRHKIIALILAAGKGTRMGSGHKPKVLHTLGDKTMLERVMDTLWKLSLEHYCLVLGDNWKEFLPFLNESHKIRICLQKKQNGTAGAVAACTNLFESEEPISYGDGTLVKGEKLTGNSSVLVCYGDTPLLTEALLSEFIAKHKECESSLSVLGMEHPNPTGYGRLVLESDKTLKGIVEEKDASSKEKKINLCNSGIILAKRKFIFELLRKVENNNNQKEYYLTDIVSLARQQNVPVQVHISKDWKRLTGVNTKDQLKEAEELSSLES